ncbi:MAG: hypothetical protein LBC75_08295 [Fibromonadaceae bacterium]|jgi:hypothetical protein|nr:hypothetical protein [Fibromonadaceae bacterium]
MKKIFIFAFFLLSCTHWIIETETRIRVENLTGDTISDFCIVSKSGQKIILVPGSIESGKKSKVYEIELVGEFDFMVQVGDDWKPEPLGIHKLKGGSLLARIREGGVNLRWN